MSREETFSSVAVDLCQFPTLRHIFGNRVRFVRVALEAQLIVIREGEVIAAGRVPADLEVEVNGIVIIGRVADNDVPLRVTGHLHRRTITTLLNPDSDSVSIFTGKRQPNLENTIVWEVTVVAFNGESGTIVVRFVARFVPLRCSHHNP